jgi:hypothetical protein
MTPVNNKSMLAFIFGQMEKLDKNEIDVNQAKAQAELAKQANNTMKYELDRVNTEIKIAQHNAVYGKPVNLRDVESKNFD